MSIDDDFDDRPEPAQRLTTARIAAGFHTAKDAARRYHWVYETYHQHEKGTRGIRTPVAKKYAAKFRVDWEWLMGGDGRGPTLEQAKLRTGLGPDALEEIEGQVDAIRETLIRQRLGSRT